MFRRIAALCRRVMKSKGFRIGIRILLWVILIYFIWGLIDALFRLMQMGFSFGKALSLIFHTTAWLSMTPYGVGLGVIIGLVWYFRRKKKRAETEDKAEAQSDVPAPPAQEEEIVKTRYYTYH